MSAMSRRKGARFERELARRFRDALPGCGARRGLQARGGGQEVADVELVGLPFHIEAKRGRKPSPRKALAQAIADAPQGRWPLAVIRDDRAEPFAVMALDDLLDLIGEWWEMRQR